jgi:hypothetical protein
MSTFPGEPPEVLDGQIVLDDAGESEHVFYVHRDKDSNWSMWEDELGQSENDAGRRFSYTLSELGIACRIDVSTGKVIAYGVKDGDEIVSLEKEITVS